MHQKEVAKMALKKQFQKIKENWLLIGLIIIAMIVFSGFNVQVPMFGAMSSKDMMYESAAMGRGGMPIYDEGFAPEAEERKITRQAGMNTEVERGEFESADQQLRNIIRSSESYILNENINTYGEREYKTGSYQLRVDTSKYDSVISQLKKIGEIKDFWETGQDVTARYTDTNIELQAEKERLQRYKKMLEEAEDTEDKITLSDRIFDQERRIKYLEQSLEKIDERIEYTSVSMTIREKESGYVDAVFVKFSELVTNLVHSLNSLLILIFVILPYTVAIAIIYGVYRLSRKKKK